MTDFQLDDLIARNILLCRRMVEVYQPDCGNIDCSECPVLEYWDDVFSFMPEDDRTFIFMLGNVCQMSFAHMAN